MHSSLTDWWTDWLQEWMEMTDWKPQIEERRTAWIQSGSLFTLGVILIKEHDLIYKVFPQYFQNCGMFPWTESNKEKFDQFLTENVFLHLPAR